MKFLFDILPIIIFFLTYKIAGIFVATAVAIIVSIIQLLVFWFMYRRLEGMLLVSCLLVVVLGTITLLLHDEMFIKWKPTAIYWVFAIAFLGSQFIGDKTIVQRMLESNIELPKKVWSRLNISWAAFFTIVGFLNIYVVYHYSTNIWVNFKLFGIIGLTILFLIAQGFYITKHIKETENMGAKSSHE